MSSSSYDPPLALTILSAISLGLGFIVAIGIAVDIALRRGWESMMWIVIPVYIINATHLWPITVWTDYKDGRPPKPKKGESMPSHCAHHPPHAGGGGGEAEKPHETETGEGTKPHERQSQSSGSGTS